MVTDTRPPPHRLGPPRRNPTVPPPARGLEACAQGEHAWARWLEQTFESLDQFGPIYQCQRCGAQHRGMP